MILLKRYANDFFPKANENLMKKTITCKSYIKMSITFLKVKK